MFNQKPGYKIRPEITIQLNIDKLKEIFSQKKLQVNLGIDRENCS